MEYEDTSTDPYASYDQSIDPYDVEGSFEFYDEGIDPAGGDELYFADGEVPPDYDYEYEELYDGPILEEEPMYTDDWLPLPPDAIPVESVPLDERPPDYGTELYIGGLQHPDPAEMRDSYCQLYPEACAEGQGLNGREAYNRTEAAEEMSRTLKDIDLTGVAIAALLLLVLLFGLHYGGDTTQPGGGDGGQERTPSDRSRRDTPGSSETPEAEKKRINDELKVGGMRDEAKRKKKVDDIMAEPDKKKRQEKVNSIVKPYYDQKLKDAGYKDDKERNEAVDNILRLPADKRAAKLDEYKKKKSGNTEPGPSNPDTGADDAGGRNRRNPRDDGGTPQPAADPARGRNGTPKAAPTPSEAEIKAAAGKLKDAGVKDDENGTNAKKVASLPKDKQSDAIEKLKTEQAAEKAKKEEARKAKDKEEREGYEKDLKAAGFTEKEAKKEAEGLMKRPKEERKSKLERLIKGKKKDAPTPQPTGSNRGGLKTEDIKKQLADAGYDEKGQDRGARAVKSKATPEEQQKELDALVAKGPKNSGKNNNSNGESQKPSDKDKKNGQAPPSERSGAGANPGGPAGGNDGSNTNSDPSDGRTVSPKSSDEVKKKLKELKYSEPAISEMIKEYKKSDPAKRAKLYKDFIDPGKKDDNERIYGKQSPDNPGAGSEVKSADELKEKLKRRGYSDPAIAKMLAEYDKADPARKAQLFSSFTDPNRKKHYEKKYGDGTKQPPERSAADQQPETNVESRTEEEETLPDEATIKRRLGRLYTPSVVDKMMKAINEEPDDKKKLELYKKLMDERQKKKNAEKYGKARPPDTAPSSQSGGGEAASQDAGKVAGMSEDDLHKKLEAKGYTDRDARDEIIDRLRAKHPDDQKAQAEALNKDYIGRSDKTIKGLNENLGNSRRAKANGKGGTEKDIPDDAELDKRLRQAGWTNDKARKQAMDTIKKGKKPEERLAEMQKHLKDGTATPEKMKSYAKKWDEAHPAEKAGIKGGSIAEMTPEDKKRIGDLLKEKGYEPDAIRNMTDELDKLDSKQRDGKLASWLNDTPENIKIRSDHRAARQKKKNQGGQRPETEGDDGSSRRRSGADPEDSNAKRPRGKDNSASPGGEGKPSPPYWILGLLLIPLLFALFKGDMTMPTGRFPVALPTLPSVGTAWAPRAPWAAREVEVVATPVGPKINRGLPELARRKTTKSVSSPRLVARSAREASSNPSISINNVNAQGENIPIDINSGGSGSGSETVIEETVVTEVTEVTEEVVTGIVVEEAVVDTPIIETVVEEAVVEAVLEEVVVEATTEEVEFRGPSDPDRLFWMLLAGAAITLPLLFDSMADWPLRKAIDTEYLSVPVHWVVLVAAALFIYLKVDRTYHWSARYGRPIIHHTRRIVTPMIVGTAQSADGLVWSVDDALFGDSQSMLGLAIVAVVFALMTIWSPFSADTKREPTDGAGQMIGLIAMLGTALLVLNA